MIQDQIMLSFEEILQKKGNGPIGHSEAKQYLRHTHPVLGVDRILDHNFAEGWLHAVRAISCSQPVFEGHFPDAAIYPGTYLIQDIIQLAILLFIGRTGPLKQSETDQEMTVVTDVKSSFGHPVAPGNILDIAVWTEQDGKARGSQLFCFDAKVRDFPYYKEPNPYGIAFQSAAKGDCELRRVRRKMYVNIGI